MRWKKQTSVKDILTLLESSISNKRDKLILNLLAYTGITVSELVNTKTDHLTPKGLTIPAQNTKSGKKKVLPLPKKLIKELKSFGKTGYLFKSRQSPKLTTRRIEQIFKVLSKKAKNQITPRDIRNAFIKDKLASKERIEKIREQTGNYTLRKKKIVIKKQIKKVRFNDDRQELIFNIIQETRCKTSELISIKIKDLEKGFLKIKETKIKLSPSLEEKLKFYTKEKDKNSYIFSTRQSEQITPRRVQQIFKSCCKNITPEMLRGYSGK